jgi:hypothetical protein
MEAVCNCRHDVVPQQPPVKQSLLSTQTRLAAVTSSRTLDLNLVTEEGDKVTLSMDAKASAIYASHGAVGMDEDEMHAQWGEFSGGQFERDISLTVEGDLNKQERREIRKVIRTINRMMKKFVQGKLAPMMAKAQKLQGLETIDNLEVEMSYENQVLVAQQTLAAVSYDRTGEMTPLKDATSGPMVEVPIKAEARAVAEDIAEKVNRADAPKAPMQALADRLLKAYGDQASQWDPLGGPIMDHIRDIFKAAVTNRV